MSNFRNRLKYAIRESQYRISNDARWPTVSKDAAEDRAYGDAADAALDVFSAQLAARDATIAALREAPAPFADAAQDVFDTHKDTDTIWEAPAAMAITAGHLRRAATALAGAPG